MRMAIIILLIATCLLIIMAYSLCAIAHDADERAERMYQKWKEEIEEKKK